MLGSFNNWNIITVSHKATTSGAFAYIYQIFLDDIIENIYSLVQSGEYTAMNTTDSTTIGGWWRVHTQDYYDRSWENGRRKNQTGRG